MGSECSVKSGMHIFEVAVLGWGVFDSVSGDEVVYEDLELELVGRFAPASCEI